MKKKVRYVDLTFDEFLAGVAGELTPAQLGVYWMICLLIYSRGEPVKNDPEWLCGKFKRGTDLRIVKNALTDLQSLGKVQAIDGYLVVNRALDALQDARNRIVSHSERGSKGGRPSKENNGIAKAELSGAGKLPLTTTTNYQLSESDQDKKGEEAPPPPALDEVQLAFDAFNEVAAEIGGTVAQVLNKERRARLGARIASVGGITGWPAVLDKIRASDFCRGGNPRGWVIDLDGLCQLKTFTKLMEGSYDNRKGTRAAVQRDGHADLVAAAADLMARGRDGRGGPAADAARDGAGAPPAMGAAGSGPCFDQASDPLGLGTDGPGPDAGAAR